MRKLLIAISLISSFQIASAQQYSLFGSNTMFDAFENPAQKSFELNSSRKFSSNFFLPYFGVNGTNRGDAEYAVRKLTQEGITDTKSLAIDKGEKNHLLANSNIYLATFRIFKSYNYQKEMGFSWQIRTDSQLDYTNESLAIFDSYTRFPDNKLIDNAFNTTGYQQTYHQFSFTYRENLNKKLAFGIKASLLSGIVYNEVDIVNSSLFIDQGNNQFTINADGRYFGNFNETNEIDENKYIPNFRNPGLSTSFGTSYTSKNGLFVMANVKDLGFIWWRSGMNGKKITGPVEISDIVGNQKSTNEQIKEIFFQNQQSVKFLAPTNAKLDLYVSKTYDFYKPGLAVSKNLFYKGGDVAFVNTFSHNYLSASVTPLYNLNNVFMVGLQAKYQTPNFEAFMGTDNLVSTATQARGLLSSNADIGSGPNGASFYMGVGIKFGDVVNHPQFSDMIPGINDEGSGSFFKNIFSVFKRK